MSPPVPPSIVSSPWPPKMTSGSVEASACTVSLSDAKTYGVRNVWSVVFTIRTTTSAPAGASAPSRLAGEDRRPLLAVDERDNHVAGVDRRRERDLVQVLPAA